MTYWLALEDISVLLKFIEMFQESSAEQDLC